MQYNNQQKRSAFIGLEVYLKGTGKQPPKYEFQSSGKIMFKDTYDKKKYGAYQFGEWLQQPHVIAKIKSGAELRLGSVDLENEMPNKYSNSNMQRKFIFFFIDPRPSTQQVDGFKPIGQTVPRYTEQQMTEARPPAPNHAQPINQSDLDEMDDEIPAF